ncbi:MAG: glutaminase domain-containing protein [Christensenellales bacterium]|jgi:hypothetical protein
MHGIACLPALPLVVNDPYLSIWCASDLLTDVDTTHWAGNTKRLRGTIVIDGKRYRYMGLGEDCAMETVSQRVTPTSTETCFQAAGVKLTLTFTTALLLDDLDLLSAPVTFVRHKAESTDGKAHEVSVSLRVYDDICYDGGIRPEIRKAGYDLDGLHVAYCGQAQQKVLCHSGDHIAIDWGYLYVASRDGARYFDDYLETGARGKADSESALSSVALIGYDDIASINYFGTLTKAWCFKDGLTMPQLLKKFDAEGEEILARCEAFDRALIEEAHAKGGDDYVKIVSAAYRHAIAAHKLIADEEGKPVLLSKENDSNGCIGTVDVSYPSSPLFLKYNPELVRALCRAVLRFSEMPVWTHDFAPHDVGRYPHAIGQVYALRNARVKNGEVYPPYYLYPASSDCYQLRYQMPVEECGNMLIMLRAAKQADGDLSLSKKHLPTLEKWARYLTEYGEDPGEQLCTDDFAGHLAHNVNLSAKAIVGVKCFAQTLRDLGDDRWTDYDEKATALAESWMRRADNPDGTPLTFDGTGWSMKYNLAWDGALNLGIFPQEFYEREVRSYQKRINKYGFPLDSRKDYTKSDWILWSASMTRDPNLFRAMIAPVARYLAESTSRVAFSDWYDTVTGKYVHFIARSVQGGLFMPLLTKE